MNTPVITVGAIETFLVALFMALVGTGIIPLSTDQIELWKLVITSGVALAAPIIGAWYLHRATTNAAKPVDTDGTPLVRADNGTPGERAADAGRTVVYELGDFGAEVAGSSARAAVRGLPVWSK